MTNTSVNLEIFIDVDDNCLTGDPAKEGADMRLKLTNISNNPYRWGNRIEFAQYWRAEWTSWQQPGFWKDEGAHPQDINVNQSDQGLQLLPTGTQAGICSVVEFRIKKRWPSDYGVAVDKYTQFGSKMRIWIEGEDRVEPIEVVLNNNRTISIDGDTVGDNEWSISTLRAAKKLTVQQDFELKEFAIIYPSAKPLINPTVRIDCGIADKIELRIFNLIGELIYKTTLDDTYLKLKDGRYIYEYTLDKGKTELASGVYVVHIEATKSSHKPIKQFKKFVIVR